MIHLFSKIVKIDATNAVMIYFFSAILYSIITVITYSSFIMPSNSDWVSILTNGAFINDISYLFWIKGLQIFDASKVASYLLLLYWQHFSDSIFR